jgi:hypothetical protein
MLEDIKQVKTLGNKLGKAEFTVLVSTAPFDSNDSLQYCASSYEISGTPELVGLALFNSIKKTILNDIYKKKLSRRFTKKKEVRKPNDHENCVRMFFSNHHPPPPLPPLPPFPPT